MQLNFIVPAEYFYALGANIPPEVTPQERYRMASLQDERSVLNEINKAIESGVSGKLNQNGSVNYPVELPVPPAQTGRPVRCPVRSPNLVEFLLDQHHPPN
jgi:hypothetical protein